MNCLNCQKEMELVQSRIMTTTEHWYECKSCGSRGMEEFEEEKQIGMRWTK